MTTFFQMFRVTGVANQETLDSGLKSTESEKRKLVSIHLECDKYAGTDDNQIVGYWEKSKQFEFPEKLFPTELAAAVAHSVHGGKMHVIPVDLEIPTGETFKVGNKCAATAVNIRGVYEYEIVQ